MPWWDPYDEIKELERRMNRIFREFWSKGPKMLAPSGAIEPYMEGVAEPLTDIRETDKEVIIKADIPGVDKADININATEDSIEISAEAQKEIEEEKEGYHRKERRYKKFYRSFSLPAPVNPEKAKAKYKNGVLEIRLPKIETKKGKKIQIE